MQPPSNLPVFVQQEPPFPATRRGDACDLLAVAEHSCVAAEWVLDYLRYRSERLT